MPIYDLYCPTCKTTKEFFIDSSKANTLDCEHCSTRLERKISAVHFRFKDITSVPNPSSFRTNKKESIVPINIVDVKEDGTFKVTSTSNNPELIND